MESDDKNQQTSAAERTTMHASGSDGTYGATIGPFRVIAPIGEGAMGVVYEAEQDRPRRRVALKVIRPGLVTPTLLRRFEHEYEFLGRLQHPGIAQVYQAGIADTGFGPQPYFAMELVRGRRLDDYVRTKELTLGQRLSLVAAIADAVQHAHHRGVIHRDLKPANILVTEAGSPKILDFGVARAAQADLHASVQTMPGEVVGTMSYMSPEQVAGDVTELDTRSDVYALGVILYELISGRLPYDLSRKSLPESVRTIRDEDPVRLTAVTRSVPTDVDTIVAKALEKDKLRRYVSAAEFAEDIRRFLRDEPIVARRPTASYQVRKFARRHKTLVGAAVGVLLALVIGAAVSTWQAVRASRAERVAQAQKARAEAVTAFLTEMLTSAQPSNTRGRELTVREVLDAAAARIDAGATSSQPEVEVAVRDAVGRTYEELGLYTEAERQLRTAIDRHPSGGDRLVLASLEARLASILFNAGNFRAAIPFAQEALDVRRELLGPKHPDVATSLADLGTMRHVNKELAAAEPLLRESLTIRREVSPPNDPKLSVALNNMAFVLREKGDVKGAETMLREALDIDRRNHGSEHPEVATKLMNLSVMLMDQRQYEAAVPLAREAVAIRRKVLGNDHPSLASAIDIMSTALWEIGARDEVLPLKREALAVAQRAFGEGHSDTGRQHHNLGRVLVDTGNYREAAEQFRAAIVSYQTAAGARHTTTGALTGLAESLYRLGDHRGAEAAAREALEAVKDPAHAQRPAVLVHLGAVLLAQGRVDEALPHLREANALYDKINPRTRAWVKHEAKSLLGAALAKKGQAKDAEPLLIAGYEGMRDLPWVPPHYLRGALERLTTFRARRR